MIKKQLEKKYLAEVKKHGFGQDTRDKNEVDSLIEDIRAVVTWNQSRINSGFRLGCNQTMIGLLTNPIRVTEILEDEAKGDKNKPSEKLKEFVEDCLENSCPKGAIEVITEETWKFLCGNYCKLSGIEYCLEQVGLAPNQFQFED